MSAHEVETGVDPTRGPGFEERDVDLRPVLRAVLIGVGVTVFSFVSMWWLYWYLADREAERSAPASPLAVEHARSAPPAPRLQERPKDDLVALRESERAVLDSYGWVDRDGGIVRLPIERAMELVAERGLPGLPQHPWTVRKENAQ